jgi:hypothetical protein
MRVTRIRNTVYSSDLKQTSRSWRTVEQLPHRKSMSPINHIPYHRDRLTSQRLDGEDVIDAALGVRSKAKLFGHFRWLMRRESLEDTED